MQTSKFIAKIHFVNGRDLTKDLLEIQTNKHLRAIVLILDFKKFQTVESVDKKCSKTIKDFPVPIISVVKGNVSKRAFSLIENSHLCIAANSAKFILSENKIDAKEALNKGLINKTGAPDEIETEAFKLAKEISELAPLAIRACLKAVNQGLEMTLEDGLKIETKLFSQIFSTEDMQEGTRAFLEKRKPVFQGK
jgi:enoyl-CoA hydratase/carnithine racemase